MLRQRLLSSVIFLPIVFLAIWFRDPWFSLVVIVAALLGLAEFYDMAAQAGWQPFSRLGAIFAVLFLINGYFGNLFTPSLLTAAVLVSLVWCLFRSPVERAFGNWAWTLAGMLYLGWLLSYGILLMNYYDRGWVLVVVLSTFAADTTAYFVGRTWGRHRLAPRVSPAKSWEGAAGGVLGGMAAAAALGAILGISAAYYKVVLLGLIIGVVGQLGDLSESLLKRSTGVKDAGHLLPGHGGVLDRLDSLLFTLPVSYYYLMWVMV